MFNYSNCVGEFLKNFADVTNNAPRIESDDGLRTSQQGLGKLRSMNIYTNFIFIVDYSFVYCCFKFNSSISRVV
jgi:hypothetical protein